MSKTNKSETFTSPGSEIFLTMLEELNMKLNLLKVVMVVMMLVTLVDQVVAVGEVNLALKIPTTLKSIR